MWTAFWVFLSGFALAMIAPMVAHTIKLAEFRQTWINELRKDIADYLGLARKWAREYDAHEILVKRKAPQADIDAKGDEVASTLTDARVILWRIQMRINPNENYFKAEDDLFLNAIAAVTNFDVVKPDEPNVSERWRELANIAVLQSRALLKREWDVTKQLRPRWLMKRRPRVLQ